MNKERDRIHHAGELFREKRFDEALALYDELWTTLPTRAPELGAVRVSFLASYIRALAEVHPPTRRRFTELRDAAGEVASQSDEVLSTMRFEWVVLNEIIGDGAPTLDWFREVKPRLPELTQAQHRKLLQRVAPVLIQDGCWAELGQLWRDPLSELRQHQDMKERTHALNARLLAPSRLEADAQLNILFRRQVLELFRSLLACGREHEADELAEEATRLEADPQLAADLAACRASTPVTTG